LIECSSKSFSCIPALLLKRVSKKGRKEGYFNGNKKL